MTAIKGIESISWSDKNVLELDIDNQCIGNQLLNIQKSLTCSLLKGHFYGMWIIVWYSGVFFLKELQWFINSSNHNEFDNYIIKDIFHFWFLWEFAKCVPHWRVGSEERAGGGGKSQCATKLDLPAPLSVTFIFQSENPEINLLPLCFII